MAKQTHMQHLKQQGLRAFEQKQYAEALEIFRTILRDRPGFADIRHYAGLCLVFMGDIEAALHELELALEQNPAYVEVHLNRALLLQELGRYDKARDSFELASQYEQQSQGRFPAPLTARLANAHAAVADLYASSQAWEEAVAEYRLALALRPRFHDIRNKYAVALLGLGRVEDAVVELQRILDWNPGFIAARLNIGLAYHRLGRGSDAAEEWEQCAQQSPDNPQVRAYLSLLEKPGEEALDG
jgi:tetratricopeptide (TPR) repeat protein